MENKLFIKVFLCMIAVMLIFSIGMYLISNGLRATYIAIPLVSVYFIWIIWAVITKKI